MIAGHAFAALAALALGAVQLAAPKGTLPHRSLGYVWAVLMLAIAISGLWIHELRMVGIWSPIHLLSVLVIVTVVRGVWHAHRHEVVRHRRGMLSLYCFALIVAGAFTLLPGRIMHQALFGAEPGPAAAACTKS